MGENAFRISTTCILFVSVLNFLPHRRLFKYFKSRYSRVQLIRLNDVVRTRGRLNSVLYNNTFLQNCLDYAVAPRAIQRRVSKSKFHHSAAIERAFVKDELEKSRLALLRVRSRFQQLYQQTRHFLGFHDYLRFSRFLSVSDQRQRAELQKKYDETIRRYCQQR